MVRQKYHIDRESDEFKDARVDVTFNVLQREKGERYACGKNGA